MHRGQTCFSVAVAALALLAGAHLCWAQPPGQAVLTPDAGAPPKVDKPVLLIVRLPATARLEIEGTTTRQTGEVREFISPPVATGYKYVYSIKATWLEQGAPVIKERQVAVQPGQQTVVDLRLPAEAKADPAANPKPGADKPAVPGADKPAAPAADKAPVAPAPPVFGTPVPPPGFIPTPPAGDKKPAPEMKDPLKPTTDRRTPNGRPKANFVSTPLDDAADDKPAPDKKADNKKPPKQPDVIFVPTPQEVVDKMLELAAVKKDDIVFDLGCGDGIIVVTAAKKYGCKAKGFDIDPERIKDSNENVKKNKVEDLVEIKNQDIFTLNLKKEGATVVTLYLLPELNVKLMPQLEQMKPGSRIVSHDFDMKGAKPDKVVKVKPKSDNEREHTIYLWTIPLKKE